MTERTSPVRWRVFVALQLPDPVRARVAALQKLLKEKFNDADLRWTKPDQFHLTLRFLGYVPSEAVPDISTAVQDACSQFHSFKLQARGAGAFPNLRRPRVLWIGLEEPTGSLSALRQAVCDATQPFTDEFEEARFSPHVTLARVKEITRQCSTELGRHIETLSQLNFGAWSVTALELMSSQLGSAGAVYTKLSAHPLRAI